MARRSRFVLTLRSEIGRGLVRSHQTIKGYRYRYRQRTWREGSHVRTESVYLGPADAGAPERAPKKRKGKSAPRPAARSSSVNTTELVIAGEREFIALMMEGGDASAFEPGYRWDARPRKKGPVLQDPDVLRIGTRMGVPMMSQIWRKRGRRDCPVYNPVEHRISVPDPARYRDVDGCSAERNLYVDTLHEVVHATKLQLGRPAHHEAPRNERQHIYDREELVAELGANLVARRLGVEPESTVRSQAYLRGYRWRLGDDAEDIAWAIREAKKAADYIVQFHPRGGWGRGAKPVPAAKPVKRS